MTNEVNDSTPLCNREELFRQKAETYLVCFVNDCPRHQDCLRWQVGQYTPDHWHGVKCINPLHRSIAEGHCVYYRNAQPVQMACGMTTTFSDLMPPKVTRHVRKALIEETNRPYYFRYRNGSLLIPPAMQERVRQLFKEAGWEDEVRFDGYVEGYDW